jgi:hypothetical protein
MNNLAQMYETDYYQWAKCNAELLQKGHFSELDIENLIEELEGMARSDRNELESRLIVLIAHLLKWQYQLNQLKEQWQGFEGQSWQRTVIEQRTQLERILGKTPSLKKSLIQVIKESYPYALKLATKETKLPIKTFPIACPYLIEQLLDEDFFP